VSRHEQDPARVSEATLQAFESDLPGPRPQAPAAPPLRRQGALILAGMAAVIAVGVIAVVAWLL
jgi:hypothetical protein